MTGALTWALVISALGVVVVRRRSVALALVAERERAIATLRARGIIVVDVAAPKLTVALLDAYLDVKSRGLL